MQEIVTSLDGLGGVGLIDEIAKWERSGADLIHILFYAGRTVFYPKNAMWYLWALIIGTIIVTEIYLKIKSWKIFWIIISALGYVFALLCNNYYFLVEGSFLGDFVSVFVRLCESARNGFFYAPFYIGLGFVLQDLYKNGFLSSHKNVTWGCFLIGAVLLIVEASLIYRLDYLDDRGVFVSQVLLIPSMVAISLLYDIRINLPYRLLRRLSTSIYFVHRTIRLIIISLPIYGGDTTTLFLASLAVSIIVALISYQSSNRAVHAVFG